jgi:hypothetical protein
VFAGSGRTPGERFRVESRSTSIDLIRRAFGAPRTKAGFGSERTPASTTYASPARRNLCIGILCAATSHQCLVLRKLPCECIVSHVQRLDEFDLCEKS